MIPNEDLRPMRAENTNDEPRESVSGHCGDGEKCNGDTFCGCPCRTCMRAVRGEYLHR